MPVRVVPQLGERLVARELPEELDGDRRRHEPGEQDPSEEEERQPDPEGREHVLSVAQVRYAEAASAAAAAPGRPCSPRPKP